MITMLVVIIIAMVTYIDNGDGNADNDDGLA